jgi:hypothetical protein
MNISRDSEGKGGLHRVAIENVHLQKNKGIVIVFCFYFYF